MFREPQFTPYDLHFTIFALPVRVHPFFWLFIMILGLNTDTSNMQRWLIYTLCWLSAAFVSVMVHELGHALLLSKVYGARTHIVLYGFGGMAIHDRYYRNKTPGTIDEILISLAGPFSGFALAGLFAAVFYALKVKFFWGVSGLGVPILGIDDVSFFMSMRTLGIFADPSPLALMLTTIVYYFVNSLFYMSIAWGVLNLLPIYPLDGGQVAREVALALDRRNGIVNSLWLSFFTALGLAAFCFVSGVQSGCGSMLLPMFFGYFAFQSYQMIMMYRL